MTYVIVDGQPVFLSFRRMGGLREEALRDKDATFRVASTIAGFSQRKEANKLVYETLLTKHRENSRKFEAEWVHFDLVGDEARENTWDLLRDYCLYTGVGGWLSDIRSFEKNLPIVMKGIR